jgi:hypothetical protein
LIKTQGLTLEKINIIFNSIKYSNVPNLEAIKRGKEDIVLTKILFSLPRIQLRILGSLETTRAELYRLLFRSITNLYNPREYPHLLYLDL